MIICLALIQVFLARGAFIAASTFTLVRLHTLTAIEAVRIADRHAVMSIASVARPACTIVGAFGVGADRVLIARVCALRAFINLHAIPLIRLREAADTFAFIGPVDVRTFGIHITMMTVLTAPLETFVSICEAEREKKSSPSRVSFRRVEN